MDYSIIIPVFNEEESLPHLYKEICELAQNHPFEIIIVNDGSTDNSKKLIEKYYNNHSLVKFINYQKNMGKTAAILEGAKLARGEYIIILDGDLQIPITEASKLYEHSKSLNLDITSGIRLNRVERSQIKVHLSKIGNLALKLVFKHNIVDSSGISCIKTSLFRKLPLSANDHRYLPHIVSLIGGTFGELKVKQQVRLYGKSKYSLIIKILQFPFEMMIMRSRYSKFKTT